MAILDGWKFSRDVESVAGGARVMTFGMKKNSEPFLHRASILMSEASNPHLTIDRSWRRARLGHLEKYTYGHSMTMEVQRHLLEPIGRVIDYTIRQCSCCSENEETMGMDLAVFGGCRICPYGEV